MARYAAAGVRVVVVCATRGEEGDVLNPRMDKPGIKERMADLRQAELETACDLLGVEAVYQLGYRDSGMPGSAANDRPDAFGNIDADEVTRRLVEIIRAERPEVVLGYDESRGYDHPDHVRVHELGTRAFDEAGRPDKLPDTKAWDPLKLYYFATFNRARMEVLHEAALALGIESPYGDWLASWDEQDVVEPQVTTKVDVSDYIELRSKALLAHATQIDPDGFWFSIPDDIHRKVYPWEDYTLVKSKVRSQMPEDDLFAGI
jgi:mycothiol S-conjugate amidase